MNSVPDGAVVNDIAGLQFSDPIQGSGELLTTTSVVLNCFSVPGYEDPFWMVTNSDGIRNPISNQTVQNSTDIGVVQLYVVSVTQYTTVLVIDTPSLSFPDVLNGVYSCQSPENSFSTSLILTNSEFMSSVCCQ